MQTPALRKLCLQTVKYGKELLQCGLERIHELFRKVRRRFGLGRGHPLDTRHGDSAARRMPQRGNRLVGEHVGRQNPRRIEERATAERIMHAVPLIDPPVIMKVLPRIIEIAVPFFWTQVRTVLRVAERAPYPTEPREDGSAQVAFDPVDTAHADLKGVFAEVALHCLHHLVLFPRRSRRDVLVFFFAVLRKDLFERFRGNDGGLGAKLVAFVFNHILPQIVFVGLAKRVENVSLAQFTQNDLYPQLFVGLDTGHEFQHVGERVYFEFLFRVLVQFKIHVRARLVCVNPEIRLTDAHIRHKRPLDAPHVVLFGVILELRRIIFHLDKLYFGIVCIKHPLDNVFVILPAPNIEMYLSAETRNLKGEERTNLPPPRTVEKGRLAGGKIETGERELHGTRRASDFARDFHLEQYRLTAGNIERLNVGYPSLPCSDDEPDGHPYRSGGDEPVEREEWEVGNEVAEYEVQAEKNDAEHERARYTPLPPVADVEQFFNPMRDWSVTAMRHGGILTRTPRIARRSYVSCW